MNTARRIVLHSRTGYVPALDALVDEWIDEGVKYVGIYGVDAFQLEDVIDEMCIGDGTAAYFMVTAAHRPEETLEDALEFANRIEFIIERDRRVPLTGPVVVVEI